MSLNTKQKDALVWFLRESPEAIGPYELADRLAGGPLQGKHPSGAWKLIRKLRQEGFIEHIADERFSITDSGREEARRIRDMRHARGGASISGKNPPEWALPRTT